MNVRLAENEMRFRVSQEEFQRMTSGEHVQLETIPLTFVVLIAKKPLEQGMVLDLSCAAVQLVISPLEIKDFQARMPSKKGIEKTLSMGTGRTLDVVFEVDVQKR